MFIVSQEQIDNIYNQLKGLEVYSFEGNSIIDPAIDIGDILIIDGKQVIYQGSSQYSGKFKANITSKIQCKAKEETTTRTPSQKTINRRVQSQIDQAEGKISQLVQETSEHESTLVKHTQSLEGLEDTVSKTTEIVDELSKDVQVYSVDLDTYSIVIPTDENQYPLEDNDYIVNFYTYFKGKQVTSIATTSSSNEGITCNIDTSIKLNVKKATKISKLSNEFIMNFIYEDEEVYTVTKKIIVTLGVKGSQGEQGKQGESGTNGNDGRGIKTTTVTYQSSTSGTQVPTGTWQTSIPSVSAGNYLWTRTLTTYTDNTTTISYSVGKMGDTGAKGDTGATGKDGTSTYFYVRYSANSNGNPMTTAPTSTTQYMGVASTTSSTAPTSYSGYTWSKIKGEQGTAGTAGATGADGKTTYLHIKYSDDGVSFTTADDDFAEGERPGAYIGQYTDFTEADSSNFADYTWYKFTQNIDSELNEMQSQISQNKTNIENNYQDIVGKMDNFATQDSLVSVEERVEAVEKENSYNINIIKDIQVNGVSKVKTETGYTFDNEGLTIEKTGAKVKSKLDEAGLEVKDATGSSDESLLYAGYDEELGETIVKSKNMTVEKYLVIGKYSRMEDFTDSNGNIGTGMFWIGG